jgi:hypothetical protein
MMQAFLKGQKLPAPTPSTSADTEHLKEQKRINKPIPWIEK